MLRYLAKRAIIALVGFAIVTNPTAVEKIKTTLTDLRYSIQSADISPVKDVEYRWSSCESTPIELNIQDLPEKTIGEVANALHSIYQQTGKRFYISKLTDEIPNQNYYLKKNKNGYPPVLIAFVERSQSDILNDYDSVAGAVANPAGKHIVTGAIAVDKYLYSSLSSENKPGRTKQALLVHELGHLLGLNHTEVGIMSPNLAKITSLNYSKKEIQQIKPEDC